MKIREAQIGDEQYLGSFLKEAWIEAGPGAPGFTGATEKTIGELASIDYLKVLLTRPKNKIFVAEDGNKFIGFASIRGSDSDAIELSGITVLNSRTGEGVGKQLLEVAKSYASSRGYHEMTVKTEVFNGRAISFYEKMGFSEIHRLTEEIEGASINLVVLRLII